MVSFTFVRVKRAGFTVLELLIIIGIVLILATLSIPIISSLRSRAQRVQCTANLRSLYVAADLYVQQNGSWPQIRRTDSENSREEHAEAWIKALEPFSIERKTWICPTMQNFMNNPDYLKTEDVRIDYLPMPFDDKPATPHQWPQAPWFVEAGDVHGSGNLIIFSDGSIKDLKTVTSQSGG